MIFRTRCSNRERSSSRSVLCRGGCVRLSLSVIVLPLPPSILGYGGQLVEVRGNAQALRTVAAPAYLGQFAVTPRQIAVCFGCFHGWYMYQRRAGTALI